MVQSRSTSPVPGLDALLRHIEECSGAQRSVAGHFLQAGARYEIPRLVFAGPAVEHERIRLGIFAGIHGDEPAGCTAAVDFLRHLATNPDQARGYDLTVYPLCNPTGYEDGRRENRDGLDLNREFWRASPQPEVIVLERELRAGRFDGIVTLHADDTCDGLYGYAHGRVLDEALLEPAIRAAEHIIPHDSRPHIDGFAARSGLICDCFKGILSPPPEQQPQPFNLIFETPARVEFGLQVAAAVVALGTIVERHRSLVAYAQHL